MQTDLKNILDSMKSSTLTNYVIPGLESSLIGKEYGTVRLFHANMNPSYPTAPHSHRYNLACLVLSGMVTNTLWKPCTENMGDFFEETNLNYMDCPGDYQKSIIGRNWYCAYKHKYSKNEWYFLDAEDIHSIEFAKNTSVLVLQSNNVSDSSVMLEPVIDGKKIPLGKTQDWMFKPK